MLVLTAVGLVWGCGECNNFTIAASNAARFMFHSI